MLYVKFDQEWPTDLGDIHVSMCGRKHGRTDRLTTEPCYTISAPCVFGHETHYLNNLSISPETRCHIFKFQGHRSTGSREEDFLKVFNIY